MSEGLAELQKAHEEHVAVLEARHAEATRKLAADNTGASEAARAALAAQARVAENDLQMALGEARLFMLDPGSLAAMRVEQLRQPMSKAATMSAYGTYFEEDAQRLAALLAGGDADVPGGGARGVDGATSVSAAKGTNKSKKKEKKENEQRKKDRRRSREETNQKK